MATNTTNYNLRKPATSDYVNVQTDLNANYDIIDTTMKGLSDDIDEVESDVSSLNATLTNVNTVTEAGSLAVVSIASGDTWVSVGSVSLSAGAYLIIGSGAFAANATGYRGLALSGIEAPSGLFTRDLAQSAGADGSNTVLQTMRYFAFNSASTVYLVARQNSGSALNLYPRITVIRLR